ncbi:unnamed protein product [Paramecium sonneborni]|uniref:Uncharacterized protein n=1 Tax=Paramecium sonneborni TaxID=65129 RepID=A0A8S1RIE9_9CILI|nr:unnamed protein product [Paramecium sonneborni]
MRINIKTLSYRYVTTIKKSQNDFEQILKGQKNYGIREMKKNYLKMRVFIERCKQKVRDSGIEQN